MSDATLKSDEIDITEWMPSINPWLSTIAVMVITFMVVLDTSIANVALPKIAGSFSATQDESVWVLTSYLVANGVILPSTAWFSTVFGRKRFLLICTAIFTISSMFCGMAHSMEFLIIARIFQGLGGGAIVPIAQAIMLESFPAEKRGLAMSVYGVGIIFAPIVGPTLGGWITDTYSWHWIFLINIPIGMLAVYLGRRFIEDPPYARKGNVQRIDYLGFLLLTVWLFTLQMVLDNGQKSDWFEAPWVRWTSLTSVTCFLSFIWWELKTKNPLIKLNVFLDRNFFVGVVLNTCVGAILFSTLAILPLFLQHLLGYTATSSGLAISPRGFGSITGIALCALLSNKVDYRFLIVWGFILLAVSNVMFGTLNLDIAMGNVILPNILCGFAFGSITIPLTTLSFATLKQAQMTDAAGLFALFRSVGGAIGISTVTTMIARKSQLYQTYLVQNLTYSNPVFEEKLAALQSAFSSYGATVAEQKANFLIHGQLLQQANLLAFMDCFKFFGAVSFILIPTVFIFKKVKYKKKTTEIAEI